MLQEKNHFTSKADVLKYLKPKLKNSKIEKIFDFTIVEWENDQNNILNQIETQFKKKTIIERSSASGEDSIKKSNAGNYESILNVQSNSKIKVTKAINSVLKSYTKKGNYNKNSQILVQNQTIGIRLSGVIFTKTPNLSAPYFVINYEEGSSTDGVTKGIVNNSVKLFTKTPISLIPKKWKKLIHSIKEIKLIINSDSLDIEFGITKSDKIIIFQVRPITSLKNYEITNLDSKLFKFIEINKKKFLKFNQKKYFGNQQIFSDMSDWNPAEIIGANPNLLDYSLYDFLIMNKIWHQGRRKIGYHNMMHSPLMVRFGNKPYVDVRASFNSLIPEIIPIHLKKKLMKFYFAKLNKNPFLHDKIEFQILFTCYDFTLDSRMNELKKHNFSNKEILDIKKYLISFTNNIINDFPIILDNCKKSIELLTKNRDLIHSTLNSQPQTHKNLIIAAEKLLNDCQQLGTLPFSTMARISFISSILLKSLSTNDNVPKQFAENFLSSIKTPISQIQNDVEYLNKNKISKKEFLKKYGHLRPGTYDITVSRYDNKNSFFENLKFLKKIKSSKFSINEDLLNKILTKHGLKFNKISFFDFIKESITQRENLKFEFTKNLSDALEIIAKIGNQMELSRHELSYLDINTIIQSKNNSFNDTKKKWTKKILSEKKYHDLSTLMILPPILFSKNDFYYLQYFISKPNFVTCKQISEDVVHLKNFEQTDLKLENKIILIEQADPGYDWIFTRKPKGLITKYGGVASHMSIRCHEVNLPAAIGCGEILYQKLLNASKIFLDCKNKQVISLVDKVDDEYMLVKKTLKSLGYTK